MRAPLIGLLLSSFLLFVGHGPAPSRAQTSTAENMNPITSTMERLDMSSMGDPVLIRYSIRRWLDVLSREKCDKGAIQKLGNALDNDGYSRLAARAHERFSETCGGHAPSLRTAVNLLLKVSDGGEAARVATELIKLEPFHDNGYLLRALAHEAIQEYNKALDDYSSAIALFGNKDRISSRSYLGMSRMYEKLGAVCDAVFPIEAWIALSPARNDTSQTREIIKSYATRGNCAAEPSGKNDVVIIKRVSGAVVVDLKLNNKAGRFILDTGATFVSISRIFAQSAGVDVDELSSVKLHTANGVTEGKLGRAKLVAVRGLTARNVPVVVQSNATATYGKGVDGLLGMSFLAHFDISFRGATVTLSRRTQR